MRIFLLAIIFAGATISCDSTKKDIVEQHEYTNELINETSPYLLQHAHNPVDWRGWNENTLQTAKEEKKLMIISVGYAACHWCHVMERESFEDSTVAAVMNKNFISVKVDREERPDVDQIYINAVTLLTGSAGWPLNVIALPDGRPIWGGTYFQKDDWMAALKQVQKAYEENPQKLEEYADKLEQGIKNMDLITLNTGDLDIKNYDTQEIMDTWEKTFDTRQGGTNRAPKFMMPNNYNYLLRRAVQSDDQELLDYVTLTLDQIAYGGVNDHIGGGFARYSTDKKWHVPHFEKMLYDNGQLVSLYSDAYLVTGNEMYKEVVEESLAFIAREMTTEEGAFYSSLDADSVTESGELEEGTYYIYNQTELKKQLGDDFELFKTYYNINSYGKWEGDHYVLIRDQNDTEIMEEFSLTAEVLNQKKKAWKSKLLDYRNLRAKPRLDDKTQTSWNALMMKGYVDAYKAFGNEAYLSAATKNATFIANQQLQSSGALFHIYKDGKSTINGYLEDYSAVIDAYIALYEVTMDVKWINLSKQLTDYAFTHFFDTESHMFYFTSDEDPALLTRNFEYRDNVIPASNSMMAKNLFILGHHFDEPKYGETSLQMLKNVMPEIAQFPSGFSNWLDLLANYQQNFYEVVVVGANAQEKINEINKTYLPNILMAGSATESDAYMLRERFIDGETFIYVCVNNACRLPVTKTEEALPFIK